ncbi:MAG: hypothetical protein JSS72_08715 [Armatimonadetes bacterium]|nr:hypothetical protein [Armatimonadota bacterium]
MLGSTLLLAAALVATQKLTPGSPQIDATVLKPYFNVWAYSAKLATGEQRTMGLWSDRLMEDIVDGRKCWKRVQGMTYYKGKSSLNLNVFDQTTLEPVSSYLVGPDGMTLEREFVKNGVKSTLTRPGEKPKLTQATYDGPAFDFWGGTYGLILATLPLKIGDSGVLNSFAELEDSLQDAPFKVVRNEEIEAGWLGKTPSTVVEVASPAYTMYFYLSKKPPYILRLFMRMLDEHGKPTGAEFDFQMIGGKDSENGLNRRSL